MVEFLIDKVFQQFQSSLNDLMKKHEREIEQNRRDINLLREANIDTKWKIALLGILSGASGGAIAQKIVELIK